ncbi:MAG TPA: glucose-1-phosphate thymidylyltransferase [Acidobacteriota bacterium]|nr:glucose-1-phosphate thymidylyltransferase [Acidobacteriota bacterium]
MKGLILSGGKGTRLRPLTYTRAKQLMPVANKPILFYGIEALASAGIREIGIIVGETKDEVMEAVGDGSRWGVTITYIEQPEPLGLAHAVFTARPFLKDSPFVMYLGDNLLKNGITSLIDDFRKSRPNSQILLASVPNPEQFGVAELEDNRVVRLEEKPKKPRSNWALVGVYMFDHHIFETEAVLKPSWRGELEITDAIQYLIHAGYRVEPHIVEGWWKDTGKLEDMLEANRLILETIHGNVEGEVDSASRLDGRVTIGKGAKVIASTIRGPAIVGENSVIDHAFIGPFTSIQDQCEIRNSEIEHSIMLRGSKILNLHRRVEGSLIGMNVHIMRSDRPPQAYRFLVGDNSKIEIY